MMEKILSAEIHMPMLPIKAFAVLALGLVAIASSFALEDNQCYRSCKARCVARYACEGRHPGPNCFTNFNKCRTSCWRMCRHLTAFFAQSKLRQYETVGQQLLLRRRTLRFLLGYWTELLRASRRACAFFVACDTLPILAGGTRVRRRRLGSGRMPSLGVSPGGGRVGN